MRRFLALGTAGLWLVAWCVSGIARADELRVVTSGGLAAAFASLAPDFERRTGHRVIVERGPSMGTTPNAVPQRLARGEPIDVVIMVGYALGDLATAGKLVPGSRVDLARSLIGAAVRQGAPHADVSTVDGLKAALLAARSVAYSDSASGVYIEKELFKRLGIEERMAGKARRVPAEPVGEVVARGDAELGFQQISELKPVHGLELLGPIPDEVQSVTIFSAGIVATSRHPAASRELIDFLASPAATTAIGESGMEPIVRK
ncbi:MAG: substrate-binding domain-containing protein [Methylobacteriaceae bacterium]|nr:substrate-binding domain-containing protein [Methylobacteriaceae bacterium]